MVAPSISFPVAIPRPVNFSCFVVDSVCEFGEHVEFAWFSLFHPAVLFRFDCRPVAQVLKDELGTVDALRVGFVPFNPPFSPTLNNFVLVDLMRGFERTIEA